MRDAGARGHDLPTSLEAGLRAALELFAREPDLAWLLIVDSGLGGDRAAMDGLRKWIACFGDLLREAAEADPRTSRQPPFLAPFLIGGVRFQIARLVLADEASDLPRLLPRLLECLLAYYVEPGEPRRLARAALGTGG
ncbi:MAG TPA: hypothetical protein VMF55_00150 [Solirubrobacterales bacterium]|nr:hypothetical protein [Solirubrobacterales bacterium]